MHEWAWDGCAVTFSLATRLAPYRLIDVGVSTLALGFQVLRAAALRQEEGQYFTPQPVIAAGIRLLQIDFDDIVIDPACGTGGFLVEALLDMQRRQKAMAGGRVGRATTAAAPPGTVKGTTIPLACIDFREVDGQVL